MKNTFSIARILLFILSTFLLKKSTVSQIVYYPPKKYSNVRVLLLINYAQGLSIGQYFYSQYRIIPTENEFLIEASSGKTKRNFYIPYTAAKGDYATYDHPVIKSILPKTNYVSGIMTYTIGNSSYRLYEHINYNCYDPLCGVKHNHLRFQTGVSYFSPEYGILVSVDNQNMQYELMASMKGKKIPHALVVEILKRRKTDESIIEAYLSQTR